MTGLKLKDARSDAVLSFEGEVPRGLTGYDGCYFLVTLTGEALCAKITAYDIQPTGWSDFFADLAEKWRGWEGVIERASLEGHLKLSATCDRLGHVRLRVTLPDIEMASEWKVETSIGIHCRPPDGVTNMNSPRSSKSL